MKKVALTPAERRVVKEIAGILVCADIETNVIAKAYEAAKGEPYDRNSPDSYLNLFFKDSPKHGLLYTFLQKSIGEVRKEMSEKLEADGDL